MKKVFLVLMALQACFLLANAQHVKDSMEVVQLEEVVVSATRAGQRTPVAYSNILGRDLRKSNVATNIPMLLQTLPSMVSFTEGGTGVGNTAFRIRGTDATRINVTLNGMPLNNPESAEVYWVNLPDLSSALQTAQIQRGVGTSTNGGSAFGASLSLQTLGGQSNPYGEASTAVGSYNTFQSNIAAGTGILRNGLSFDARYSYITSDGYIRNAFVDHNNLYLSLSHYADKQLVRLVYLRGRQHTGITWEGVTADQMEDEEWGRRYNPTGEYEDEAGNRLYYDDDSDNYESDIVQFIYTRNLTPSLDVSANLSYNHGFGYYENYKTGRKFKEFNLDPQVVEGIEYTRTDLVRQKLMSNDFYVANVGLSYHHNAWKVQGGALYTYYDGNHFGSLPWIKWVAPENRDRLRNYEWYRNKGVKQEGNVFAKVEYAATPRLTLFGDLQGRFISYKFSGIDDDLATLDNHYTYNFFNPKAGAFFRINDQHQLFGSFAVGNREPMRADLKDSKKWGSKAEIKPERMYDYELGYKFNRNGYAFGVNLYYMAYDNQMVQTGRLSDVGYKLMENVKDSYRRGVELEASLPVVPNKLKIDANATLSQNKIRRYDAYFDVINTDWDVIDQVHETLENSTISFSPSVVSSVVVGYIPTSSWSFNLMGKYVSKQYFDNTQTDSRSLPAYFVSNLAVGYTLPKMPVGQISLQFFVNNLFGSLYSANGYASLSYLRDGGTDTPMDYVGFYPQAPRNYMGRLTIRF